MEDFRCAADYLVTLDYVDEDRIGVLGICGGGGYAANAAMTDRRFKALGTVTGVNFGRMMREGALSSDSGSDAAIAALDAVAKQRTAEARGAEPRVDVALPDSPEKAEELGITALDVLEATKYYRTERGQQPHGVNKSLFSTWTRPRLGRLPPRRAAPHPAAPDRHRRHPGRIRRLPRRIRVLQPRTLAAQGHPRRARPVPLRHVLEARSNRTGPRRPDPLLQQAPLTGSPRTVN